ncbi:MAG: hypothetical protein ABIM74_03215 [candidate division WOR-3 bacterium]
MINTITLIAVALGVVILGVLLVLILIRMRAVDETRSELARSFGAVDTIRNMVSESMSRAYRRKREG